MSGQLVEPPKGMLWIDVHVRMLVEIAHSYHCLPDLRTLSASDIRWYYGNIVASLKEASKPRK